MFRYWQRPDYRVAKGEEIESMCNFIGGFKKWPLLNDDCKRKVLEVMDIYTRLSLGMCSKGDYSLMNTTPFFVHEIEVDDSEKNLPEFQEEEFKNVQVCVKRDTVRPTHDEMNFSSTRRQPDEIHWVFSQQGKDTRIRWVPRFHKRIPQKEVPQKEVPQKKVPQKKTSKKKRTPEKKREIILKNCDYYEEAVKFTEMWMKRCHFKMKSIEITMEKYPMEKSRIVSLPKCTNAALRLATENEFHWWLQKLPSRLELLELNLRKSVISRDFLSSPQIVNAEKFYAPSGGDFSDEQLMNMKSIEIGICAEGITDQCINQFLKRWVSGNGVKGFEVFWIRRERQFNTGEILKGVEVRPWDDTFRREQVAFHTAFLNFWGDGFRWQVASRVDPFECLTVLHREDTLYFVHTGHRSETERGEPCMCYSV